MWYSELKIWHYPSCGSVCSCGAGSVLSPGTSTCHGLSQNKSFLRGCHTHDRLQRGYGSAEISAPGQLGGGLQGPLDTSFADSSMTDVMLSTHVCERIPNTHVIAFKASKAG